MRMVIKTYVIKSRPGTHEEVELASLSKRVKKMVSVLLMKDGQFFFIMVSASSMKASAALCII